jgi:pyruvate dehydrogenase E2 component (dihydrolipoamide acetyltransferase)
MAISVVMPALEMAQENGKLLGWKKKEGEHVAKGEPLLEVETDKAVVEVESPGEGILAGISADVGAEIPVGQTIAWLVKPGEQPPAHPATSGATGRAASGKDSAGAGVAPAARSAPSHTPQISPKARRLAKELGVEISAIRGTGPDGVITVEDVQAAAAGAMTPPRGARAAVETAPLAQVARIMAEKTTQSWTSVPHFFLSRDVDCSELLKKQEALAPMVEKTPSLKLTVTDLLVRLTAKVLEKHPKMNSSWTGNNIRHNAEINISLAIAVQDGVVGAVIHRANTLGLPEISAERRDLAERARANKLRPADITGGTFTISNLGMFQVDSFLALITPPQAAILAVGAIADRVVAVGGKPEVRPILNMSLSTDHRVADGARAAEFLRDLADAIADPARWLE